MTYRPPLLDVQRKNRAGTEQESYGTGYHMIYSLDEYSIV